MADDRCGTGLDGDEDAWPWCDVCWEAQRSGSSLDIDAVKQNILNRSAAIEICDLPGCPNEADAKLEVRVGALIRLALCPRHADDLESGLESGSWRISDGASNPAAVPSAA